LKGKFKNDFKLKRNKLYKTDIAVVGDFVDFENADENSGVISKIEIRENYISRKSPKIKGAGYRGERLEQVIAANIDSLFIISSVVLPYFNNKVIDRFLVTAESSGIKPYIIINKTDLDEENLIDDWAAIYENIGYKVFRSSVINNSGIDAIKKTLVNKKNLFWGQSGVGKSSIINKMFPDLNLGVGEISNFTDKGKHTTVTSIMIEADNDTFIIDTPGVREIDPFGIRKEDLGHYFIEFSDFALDCRFNTCTHLHEPGCAVIEAVEKEKISPERYDSYLRILETIEQDIVF
jgi:ribosome biogenesis GTPase